MMHQILKCAFILFVLHSCSNRSEVAIHELNGELSYELSTCIRQSKVLDQSKIIQLIGNHFDYSGINLTIDSSANSKYASIRQGVVLPAPGSQFLAESDSLDILSYDFDEHILGDIWIDYVLYTKKGVDKTLLNYRVYRCSGSEYYEYLEDKNFGDCHPVISFVLSLDN